MNDAWTVFGFIWLLTQAASLAMMGIGVRYAAHRYLVTLGALAQRQKLQAMDRIWPLTRLRVAARQGQLAICTLILGGLIVLKSLACLLLGIVMVFWLPVASLMVPAIVAVHDPDDPTLMTWVRRVATLQLTSHALAAALGATLVLLGPLATKTLTQVIVDNDLLCGVVSVAAYGFALAAGRMEAAGVIERGI